jgi:hypothetical protein
MSDENVAIIRRLAELVNAGDLEAELGLIHPAVELFTYEEEPEAVAAIILSSATVFSVVKYAGAAYLVYLGLSTSLERRQLIVAGPAGPARTPRRLYWEGCWSGR